MMFKRMVGYGLAIALLFCVCFMIITAVAEEMGDEPAEGKLVSFSDKYPVGLEMSMEEFEKQAPALVSAAEKWDRETVPQTLDEFPVAIGPFMDVFSRISAASSVLTVEDRQYLWETDLGGLFTENVPDKFDISLDYEDSECSIYLPPIQEKDDTFLFEIPDGVTRSDVKRVSYDCFWYPSEEWYVILQIHYDIKNDVLDDMPYVCIYYTGEEYSFSFGTDLSGEFMTDMFAIHIGKIHENTVNPVWGLAYSMKDGKIIGMENDNQQIDFRD